MTAGSKATGTYVFMDRERFFWLVEFTQAFNATRLGNIKRVGKGKRNKDWM